MRAQWRREEIVNKSMLPSYWEFLYVSEIMTILGSSVLIKRCLSSCSCDKYSPLVLSIMVRCYISLGLIIEK